MPRFSNLFFTGFEPFADNSVNPSSHYAEALAAAHNARSIILPVSDECHEVLRQVAFPSGSLIFMMGLSAGADQFEVEICSCRGKVVMPTTVCLHGLQLPEKCRYSRDAGNYYCNAVYGQVLQEHPNCSVIFVHVPLFTDLPFEEGMVILDSLVKRLICFPEATSRHRVLRSILPV